MREHDEDILSDSANALLRSARGGEDPTPAEHARLAARLAERERSVEHSTGRGTSARLHSRWRATLMAALIITGSLGALASPGVRKSVKQLVSQLPWLAPSEPGSSSATTPQARANAPHRAPPKPTQATSLTVPEPLGEAPTPPQATASMQASPNVNDRTPRARAGSAPLNPSIDSELALVTTARDALARGDHAAVESLVRSHRLQFRRGELTPEIAGIEALSDCRRGAGSARAASFLARYPTALLGPRLRRDCGLDTNSVPSPPSDRTHETTTQD